MTSLRLSAFAVLFLTSTGLAWADPPVAAYIFPAGGQRGKTVACKVGGLNLFQACGFEMLGTGIQAPGKLQRIPTLWLEGPVLPLPDSQQAEDYPKDMAAPLSIAADAEPGIRYWRVWTSQGSTPALKFMVGELPEIVETEQAGDPVPVEVQLPVTINGRIFPREDVDIWAFKAAKGQTITAEVHAARLGSPLDARLELLDPQGRRLAENDDTYGADPFLCFTAPADGTYQIRIHDINFKGGQAYVYRLTLQARPHVTHYYPLGGQRGTKIALELAGQGLREPRIEVAVPADARREFAQRVNVAGQLSNPLLLDIDDLPEHQKTEANDAAQAITVPAILNGRIRKAGAVERWSFAASKGVALELDLKAMRLGSPLCAVLTVLDAAGKELARAENNGTIDPLLRFTPPADGTYSLQIAERYRGRAGNAFAYRLRIALPPTAAPDFRLFLSTDALAAARQSGGPNQVGDAVTLPRGGTVKLKILAERLGGLADAIPLEIDGLPAGVSATGTIPAKQTAGEITFKADAAALVQASRLTIRGKVQQGDRQLVHQAVSPPVRGEAELDSVLLAVSVATPFKIVGVYDMSWVPRGSLHRRNYRIERNGFEGPIEVCLADRQARHLQGVTGGTITVPAGVTEFSYEVYLPPWMETGRTSRTCVMGCALLKDADGAEHVVSYSSTNQNEQIVAVVEPGRLSVEAIPGSVAIVPGQAGSVQVQVGRGKGLQGAVKLELIMVGQRHGIAAEPVTIAADQSRGPFPIRLTADARGPFKSPLILRATIMDQGKPIVAEMPLTIVPER